MVSRPLIKLGISCQEQPGRLGSSIPMEDEDGHLGNTRVTFREEQVGFLGFLLLSSYCHYYCHYYCYDY